MKGYASSALAVPVHVQNLVIRNYCALHGFSYELSETENKAGFEVLARVLASNPEGIVAYSVEQFDAAALASVKCALHFAMEGFERDGWTETLRNLMILTK